MLQFKKITLEDKEILTEKLKKLNCKLLNYNFVVMFIYRNVIHFEYALFNDFLVVKTNFNNREQFLFPVGEGDLHAVLNEIKEYAFVNSDCYFFQFCDNNAPVLMEWIKKMNQTQEHQYNLYEVRGEFEYIYSTKDLMELNGHEFKPKRNHINHFLKHYNWSEEVIDEHNLPEVVAFSEEWDKKKKVDPCSRLHIENIALKETLDHYQALEIQGLLLRVEGKVVAFSVGCPLCEDTFLVLFEKSDWEINGSYAMINREFVRNIASEYTYINRAEDCDVEGLRKAKMSYNPVYLQKVYHLDILRNK